MKRTDASCISEECPQPDGCASKAWIIPLGGRLTGKSYASGFTG
jgi:hypothetical protein